MSHDAGGSVLDLAVPEDLLRAASATARPDAADALDDLVVPGVGDGAPPRLRDVLQRGDMRPVTALAAAAFLAHTLESSIGILGPDIQDTFGLSDAGLGAVAFVMSGSYLALGVPVALAADRGRRTTVAAVALLSWALVVPLLGLAPNVWVMVALLLVAGVGRAAPNSAHLSYLSDAYPVSVRARVLALHRAAEPIARTVGAGAVALVADLAGGVEGWRWAMLIGLLGVPVAYAVQRLREPARGANERATFLDAGEADDADGPAPRILLGSAVQRLLRIRTLYFMFVAMAVLGFAAVGIPLIGNLYLEERWGLDTGERGLVGVLVGGATFLGIPVAGLVGDRLFRRSPEKPLLLAGASLAGFGILYGTALHLPRIWMVVAGWVLAEACLAPLATAITQTVAAAAPPAFRSLAFALFGVYSLVFGGFAGSVILGSISDARGPAFALTLMAPITIVGGLLLVAGSRHVKRDIGLAIEDLLEEHAERTRRRSGGTTNALQVRNLDFSYGAQQVLFDVNLDVDDGEVCALLGTNGAGKSTLLRAVAGLEHPTRGTVRVFGANTTWLEAEQLVDLGVSLLAGGRMTFAGLTVDENLRAGTHAFRKEARLSAALDEVFATFPRLHERRAQRAGTLSGGEQQMLALARVLLHRPRLLLVDEFTLGLAPKVVEELLSVVRTVNQRGTTIVLVEQSVNLALTLADHSFFLERGEVRFDGSTSELLARDDLLRPVFLTESSEVHP